MKINDKDIVRTAQELRDEENQQLHVRPWSRNRHFHFPAWLAAIPAAAIIGFLFGFWANSQTKPEQPLTALVDTVYVTKKEAPENLDSTHLINTPLPTQPARIQGRNTNISKQSLEQHTGQPMVSDRIRYDLLVKN